MDIIKNNCNFDFIDITPTVLDGGDEIVLAIGQMINT